MPRFIEEAKFFTFLSWISVSLSGVIVSISLGESFLYTTHSPFKYFGACSFPEESPALDIQFALMIFFVLFTLGIQITLFFKQRQLWKERTSGILVVTYNNEGVTISRRCADESLGRKLINYDRTVVSPKASFWVFLSNALRVLILVLVFSIEDCTTSDPSIILQFYVYVDLCVHFFLFTLVEHYFSPILFNAIFDYIPWHNRAYIVPVNV